MKNIKIIQSLSILILFTGVQILSGCGSFINNVSMDPCEYGKPQLPTKWTEAKFPVVEGGNICSGDDNQARIQYKDIEFFELFDKYAEKFKSGGWKLDSAEKDRSYAVVSKDNKKFSVSFSACYNKVFKCSKINISEF